MGRKTSESQTRIYTYGALPPTNGADLLHLQLEASPTYFNQLIDIERERFAEHRRAENRHYPELATLEQQVADIQAELECAYAELRKERQRKRKRVSPAEMLGKIQALKTVRATLWTEQKMLRARIRADLKPARDSFAARKKALIAERGDSPHGRKKINAELIETMLNEQWPDLWKDLQRIDAASLARVKAARAESVLDAGGTKGMIETAVETAVTRRSKRMQPPERKRGAPEGRIGLQIQSGRSKRFWVDPLPENAWATRSARRHAYTTAHFVFADGQIDLPILMDRPLPPDAVIKWAYVLMRRAPQLESRRHGRRGIRYELQIVFETERPDYQWRRPDADSPYEWQRLRPGYGSVALNYGWRKVGGGMRVAAAVAVDEKGAPLEWKINQREAALGWRRTDAGAELVLSEELLADLSFDERLRSIGDQRFNEAVRLLSLVLRWRGDELPQWLREATATIASWRGHGRLADVAFRFARERLPEQKLDALWKAWVIDRRPKNSPSLDTFPRPMTELDRWLRARGISHSLDRVAIALEWWRRKNRHLYDWEHGQRDRALRRRRDIYRNVAALLSARFHDLVYDNTRFSAMARRPADDAPDESWDAARYQRHTGSPGQLRQLIIEAFGDRITEVDAKDNSTRCAGCGGKLKFSCADDDRPVCTACGVSRDTDLNNALNQLGKAGKRERSGDPKNPGGARSVPIGPEST